jgi:hypothetical protein
MTKEEKDPFAATLPVRSKQPAAELMKTETNLTPALANQGDTMPLDEGHIREMSCKAVDNEESTFDKEGKSTANSAAAAQ